MAKRFYPPKLDYVFKRVFGDQRNTHILAAFLNAVMEIPIEDRQQLTIIDPYLKPAFTEDKTSILDVKIRHPSGAITDVEIQLKVDQDLRKRVTYTTAKMLAEQLKRGDDYHQAQRVVSIIICGETLLFEEPGYYNEYSVYNKRSGKEFADLMEIIVLEPSKLRLGTGGGPRYNWLRFLRAETKEELIMAGRADPVIQEAVDLVLEVNEDERERARADSRWKWQVDQAARERTSYNKGLEKGKEKAEAAYRPIIEEMRREVAKQAREVAELRRKLREAGIDL